MQRGGTRGRLADCRCHQIVVLYAGDSRLDEPPGGKAGSMQERDAVDIWGLRGRPADPLVRFPAWRIDQDVHDEIGRAHV